MGVSSGALYAVCGVGVEWWEYWSLVMFLKKGFYNKTQSYHFHRKKGIRTMLVSYFLLKLIF